MADKIENCRSITILLLVNYINVKNMLACPVYSIFIIIARWMESVPFKKNPLDLRFKKEKNYTNKLHDSHSHLLQTYVHLRLSSNDSLQKHCAPSSISSSSSMIIIIKIVSTVLASVQGLYRVNSSPWQPLVSSLLLLLYGTGLSGPTHTQAGPSVTGQLLGFSQSNVFLGVPLRGRWM